MGPLRRLRQPSLDGIARRGGVLRPPGVTTGVGGACCATSWRCDTPALVDPRSELYAIPAIVGSLAVALFSELEAYEPLLGAAIGAAIVAVRLLALARGWRAPVARPPRTAAR